MSTVDALKAEGNKAFSEHNYQRAIDLYTDALDIDPSNQALYSNRSACYCSLQKFQEAAADARKAIELKPDWSRAYQRLGAALQGQKLFQDAIEAFTKASQLDPNNANIKQDIATCQAQLQQQRAQPNPFAEIAQLFTPDKLDSLRYNPLTQQFFNEPDFVQIIENIKRDPNSIMNYAQDKRLSTCMQVLLAPFLEKMKASQPQNAGETPSRDEHSSSDDEHEEPAPKPAPTPKPEAPKRTANEEAEAEKLKGNELFKAGDLDGAIAHYDKAIEIEPHNITYTNNKASCLIKQKKFEEAIKLCKDAIEDGRENHADFEQIAKAYTKIASAYTGLNNLEEAIKALNASILEKKDPTVKRELTRLENLKAKRDAAAYENPEIAEQERIAGNEDFKNGKIPDAIKHYNEAIKRAPRDPKLYSNRAAAYSKLGEMPMALKDCDKAIELDPNFVKAYTRKGYCHTQMKEYHKALDDYNEALRIDKNCAEAISGVNSVNSIIQAQAYTAPDEEQIRHSMADPEIKQILSDPYIQQILQECQQNPSKLQQYLSDPRVSSAFMKLRAAGIIR